MRHYRVSETVAKNLIESESTDDERTKYADTATRKAMGNYGEPRTNAR